MIYVFGTNLAEGEIASWERDSHMVPPCYLLSDDGSTILVVARPNRYIVPVASLTNREDFYRRVAGVIEAVGLGVWNTNHILRVFTQSNSVGTPLAVGLALLQTEWLPPEPIPLVDSPSVLRSLLPDRLDSAALHLLRGALQRTWPPIVQSPGDLPQRTWPPIVQSPGDLPTSVIEPVEKPGRSRFSLIDDF